MHLQRRARSGLIYLGAGLAMIVLARLGTAAADVVVLSLQAARLYLILGLLGALLAVVGMAFLFMAAISADQRD